MVDRRQCIRPNVSFLQQLGQYESEIFGDGVEHSVDHKDLRSIQRLYRKWLKELHGKGANKDQISRDMITNINSQTNQVLAHDVDNGALANAEEAKGDMT